MCVVLLKFRTLSAPLTDAATRMPSVLGLTKQFLYLRWNNILKFDKEEFFCYSKILAEKTQNVLQ